MNSKGSSAVRNDISNRGSSSTPLSTAVANSLKYYGYVGVEGGNTNGKQAGSSRVSGSISKQYAKTNAKGTDKVVTFGNGTYIDSDGNEVSVEVIHKGSWGKQTAKADDGTLYREFLTQDGDIFYLNPNELQLTAWQDSTNFDADIDEYAKAYEEYKALPNDRKPDTWYSLYKKDNGYSPIVYNQMIVYNFDKEKLRNWFASNPKYIVWKQTVQNN